MGKDRERDNLYPTEGAVMEGISMRYTVDSRQLLLTAYCLLLTIFTGCGHQIIITKDPLNAAEHISLAQVYDTKGETDLAVQEYNTALEIDKTNPMVYFGLGNIAIKKGRYADAEVYYKKAIENTSSDDIRNAMFYNNLSWVYIDGKKDLKEAERLVQKAIQLDTVGQYIYLDTLGVIYTKSREYTKAEEILLSALRSAGDNKTALKHIYQHLSELYQMTGDETKRNDTIQKLDALGVK